MITDYKYRKLRKMVTSANVGKNTKKMLLCALHDYKYNGTKPINGVFKEGKQRCLVGAALHDRGVVARAKSIYDDFDWEFEATKQFGMKANQVESVIAGFDFSGYGYSSLNNTTERLANTLAIELGVKEAPEPLPRTGD